jgi:branched-chain amino acid transport system permease protein
VSSPPRASGYFRTGYAQDFALVETRLRRASLAIFVLALVAYPLVASPFGLDLASQVFLNAIGALALMLLTGYAGQISLGWRPAPTRPASCSASSTRRSG